MPPNFKIGKCYRIAKEREQVCLFQSDKTIVSLSQKDKTFYFVFLGLVVINCGTKEDYKPKMKLLHDSKIYYLHPGWFGTIEEI